MRAETSGWPRCAREAVATRRLSGLMGVSMPGSQLLLENYLKWCVYREWVSPATVTWMLKEVVENDTAHPDLTETLDWILWSPIKVLPPLPQPWWICLHQNQQQDVEKDKIRQWRNSWMQGGHFKLVIWNNVNSMKGVDANRNYGHHWNEGGSSNDK